MSLYKCHGRPRLSIPPRQLAIASLWGATEKREDDNRVVPFKRPPAANSFQLLTTHCSDNPPQLNSSQSSTGTGNPALANPPLPNSTLDTVMAATMQVLDYVWKRKSWIITGAVAGGAAAGGAVAAARVGIAAGPVVVGIAGGAVVGLAAKKIKDKCTQLPPHEHQD